MLKEQKTACEEEDNQKNNSVAQTMSLKEKSNSSTQITNSSSYVSIKYSNGSGSGSDLDLDSHSSHSKVASNDGSDDKFGFEGKIEFDFAFVLLPCGEDDDVKPFLLPKIDD